MRTDLVQTTIAVLRHGTSKLAYLNLKSLVDTQVGEAAAKRLGNIVTNKGDEVLIDVPDDDLAIYEYINPY